jgi:FKBP-type peptidyl-prolyl cis-trans isomerase FklB
MTLRTTTLALVAMLAAGAAAAQDAPTLTSQKDRRSYALGVDIGVTLAQQALDVDPALIVRGLEDALADKKMLLSQDDIHALVVELHNEMQQKQIAAAQQRAERNKKDGEAFLAANKAKEGVVTLPSGLQYKVLKAGEGPKPTAADIVVCHYRGTLVDGTEFDSSFKRNEPLTIPVGRVIKGWTEALQLMPVGSKWQLVIPANLAYGERGPGGPNSTLVFEVELLSIKEKPAAATLPPAAPAPKTTP